MLKRVAGLTLFLAVFLTVYGALNYYIYLNLAQFLSLSPGGLLALGIAIVLLALAYPFAQIFKARWHRVGWLLYVGALWMGFLCIALFIFGAKDLLTFFVGDLVTGVQIGVGITVFLLFLLAVLKARRPPSLKTISVPAGKLSQPLRIVHLSDIHLGSMTSRQWLERVVTQVNGMDADLVVITGDLVEDSLAVVAEFVPLFGAMEARYGVFAVSGNHEYYQGIEHFRCFCQAAGITVVDGNAVSIAPGVNIMGLGGEVTTAVRGFGDRVRQLMASAVPGDYNILLIHHPVGFAKAANLGIDLQLSGHTHRGQILPVNFLVPLVYRYSYGLHNCGDAYIYTSSGTGTWGPPLRLGSQSEIVQIDVS